MKRMSFREDEESHNFWQNYTDLLAGLLIVFIIIAVSATTFYKESAKNQTEVVILRNQLDSLKNVLDIDGDINDTIVNKIIEDRNLVKRLEAFSSVLRNIDNTSSYFSYNKEHDRIECTIDGELFNPNSCKIHEDKEDILREAGDELDRIMRGMNDSLIGMKVIIDGRVAKYLDEDHVKANNTEPNPEDAAKLSYQRAKALYDFWKKDGLLSSIEENGEIFFSGSGYGGKGRYTGIEEDLNKRFIIEIIPYIKF